MLTIGLTGSLGTGKSTVAKMFAEWGAKILDADKMAHRQLYRGQKGFERVVKLFGKKILIQGRIDRKKLGAIVFQNRSFLKKLENIIHPMVHQEMIKKLKKYSKTSKIVVMDVPLLFESGLDAYADRTVVVKTNQRVQLKRIIQHFALTKTQALQRMQIQMPLREKIRRADFIIDNNQSLNKTQEQAEKIWQNFLQT